MALSQDEQRMLAEIERRLAADDPGLASRLTTFRRPGPGAVLRSPRARIVGSLFTVLLVAMVSLMVYAMIPFRTAHTPRQAPPTTASAQVTTAVSAPRSSPPGDTQQSSTNVSSTVSQSSQGSGNHAAATGKPPQANAKPNELVPEAP